MTVEELMKANDELRAALADLQPKYQHLRATEMTQSWIIGAMSGAVFVFVAVVLLQYTAR
jgi:hypothetical protein